MLTYCGAPLTTRAAAELAVPAPLIDLPGVQTAPSMCEIERRRGPLGVWVSFRLTAAPQCPAHPLQHGTPERCGGRPARAELGTAAAETLLPFGTGVSRGV